MVAAGNESHAHFTRIVGLRLGNLTSDEGLGAGSNRRLKITLGAARSPRYCFDSCFGLSYGRYRPF